MNSKIGIIFLCLIVSVQAYAAESAAIDFFRSQGKIYVVVAVLLAVFIGIIVYLISLDRKISRLENRIKNE
jgi:CcmD family protein